MQSIQHPFARQQHLVVELERERPLQPRFIARLRQEISQRAELALQVQLPSVSAYLGHPRQSSHSHELSHAGVKVRMPGGTHGEERFLLVLVHGQRWLRLRYIRPARVRRDELGVQVAEVEAEAYVSDAYG